MDRIPECLAVVIVLAWPEHTHKHTRTHHPETINSTYGTSGYKNACISRKESIIVTDRLKIKVLW